MFVVQDEEPQPVNLVPELCYPTGYTEEMRKNFNLMRDVAQFKRVGPAQRVQRLLQFNQRLHNTSASMKVLGSWGLHLEPNSVSIPAQQLPWEQIKLSNERWKVFYSICD